MKSSLSILYNPAFALSVCLIALHLSGNVVNAQLIGCNAINCPKSQNSPFQFDCPVDGAVNTLVGIANVTSTITPQPLTWTVGISSTSDPTNDTESIYFRNFYLGSPPGLDLEKLSNTTGCALFFDGITSQLKFPGYIETSIGTCSDALSAGCVTDLLNQATSTLATLDSASGDVCDVLASELVNKAPPSCGVAQSGSWATINAKAITGPSAPLPVVLDDCSPTTGKGYSLTHVESQNLTAPGEVQITEPFLGGVTPILTVFKPSSNNSSDDGLPASLKRSLQGLDVHLSCLKIVNDAQPATDPSVTANLARGFPQTPSKLAVSLLIVYATMSMFF
ncbi:hypothetical protein CLAIMM_04669 [Cladophialophora immunda]|nr:hypothetical protein CLAIMM_04669 [Cladophialophora immunda]